MTALYPGHGLSSPALSYQNVDYTQLLTEPFEGVQIWEDLLTTMTTVWDATVHYPIDQLYALRSANADLKFINSNIAMMGYQVNLSVNIDADTSLLLLKNVAIFSRTRGTSTSFLNFIGYLQHTQFQYMPLWADSLTMSIEDLTADYGTTVWNGGTWFPTPYFDVGYNESDYPNLDITQLSELLEPIMPIYLVLRSFTSSFTTTVNYYETGFLLDSSELTTSNTDS